MRRYWFIKLSPSPLSLSLSSSFVFLINSEVIISQNVTGLEPGVCWRHRWLMKSAQCVPSPIIAANVKVRRLPLRGISFRENLRNLFLIWGNLRDTKCIKIRKMVNLNEKEKWTLEFAATISWRFRFLFSAKPNVKANQCQNRDFFRICCV